MPEIPKSTDETKAKTDIKKLKLETVNNFRTQIGGILKRAGFVLGAGIIAGALTGKALQNEYRDWSGYDPDKPPSLELPLPDDKPEKGDSPAEKEEGGWQDRLKRRLEEAGEAVKDTVVDQIENTELVQEYIEELEDGLNEMNSKYQQLMEAVDKASFWLPFLLAFLATVKIVNSGIRIKKKLTEGVDPIVESNMKKIEKKINVLITRVNELTKKDPISPDEESKLMKEIEELKERMEAQEETIRELMSE